MKPFMNCPACQGKLHISALQCSGCGMELKNSFSFSAFDSLTEEQHAFLLAFLQCRGNLKDVQEKLGISYFIARKKLDDLLIELNLAEQEDKPAIGEEMYDMRNWITNAGSKKPSEIIKHKLKEHGGRVIVHTARGLPCEICVAADGVSFVSDKLPIKPPYEFRVFDMIVDMLRASGGKAPKGNGRNYKLGQPGCDETTVVGYIGKHYAGRKDGNSVFDPVFVLAAVLEWAGIAENGRGELILNAAYME